MKKIIIWVIAITAIIVGINKISGVNNQKLVNVINNY